MNVAGLILAGGQSRRMGTDKSFVALNGVPLIQQVIDRARPQVSVLAVNTNSDDLRYGTLGLPLVQDLHTGFQGPLAGLHAGLTWLQFQDAEWLATFACDTPFFPTDLVQKLWDCVHASSGRAAVARSGGKNASGDRIVASRHFGGCRCMAARRHTQDDGLCGPCVSGLG